MIRFFESEYLTFVLIIAVLAIVFSNPFSYLKAAEAAETVPSRCVGNRCLIVEYEDSLVGEAANLADALAIRMAKHGINVKIKNDRDDSNMFFEKLEFEDSDPKSANRLLWVVHLRLLSPEFILLAVDCRSKERGDDVVREVRRADTIASTAWTMAIIIEEAITPYLNSANNTVLGAGLSIIEPPLVGGARKQMQKSEQTYPKLKSFGLSLAMYAVTETDDVIAGPRASVEGVFSEEMIASISLAWVGWANFYKGDIEGSMSLIPLDIMVGYMILPDRMVELNLLGGFSVGFGAYKTSNRERERKDVLFEPMAQVLGRIVFNLPGPLGVYVDGGIAVPLVRDAIENQGVSLLERNWILPFFDIGFELRL